MDGHPGENWFPWLKGQLAEEGHDAIVPAFPHAGHPKLDEWLKRFRQHEPSVDANSIFVGHSLGAAFALRLLEKRTTPIRSAFLIAPVWGVMGNAYDPLMTTFTVSPYDWDTIKKNCGSFHVIQSDNDPYIRSTLAESLAKNLGVAITLIKGAGHFNTAAGYTTFPFLLERITSSYPD